jgi:hypothetical protein
LNEAYDDIVSLLKEIIEFFKKNFEKINKTRYNFPKDMNSKLEEVVKCIKLKSEEKFRN